MEPLKLRIGTITNDAIAQERNLLYRSQSKLAVGDIHRFIVTYNNHNNEETVTAIDATQSYQPSDIFKRAPDSPTTTQKYISLLMRNVESDILRPFYLTGPFSFYVDCVPYNYNHLQDFSEPVNYNQDVKPGQSFKCKLLMNENSKVEEGVYRWTIDIVSQITIATHFKINYEMLLGYDPDLLKQTSIKGTSPTVISSACLKVEKLLTEQLWSVPPKNPEDHVHLVVLTHGIFSNVGADMHYIKEQIESKTEDNPDSNIIVRGYFGNVGKSDKGVKYLGKRVADWLLDFCDKTEYKIDRISFIGHSLGGLTQAYVVYYIALTRPRFFETIHPVNFITMASPMLGILAEFPKPISFALDLGALGTTGRDLTLAHTITTSSKPSTSTNPHHFSKKLSSKPILEILPTEPAHEVLKSFLNRTVYANAIHDGIVPLRTSALLYLDWQGLGDLKKLKERHSDQDENNVFDGLPNKNNQQKVHHPRQHSVGTIPSSEAKESGGSTVSHRKSSDKQNRVFALKENESFDLILDPRKARQKRRAKKYMRSQTIDSNVPENNQSPSDSTSAEDNLHIPPVASTFLSGVLAMLSPHPREDYIMDPSAREPTIFHDKLYSYSDLPQPHYTKKINPLKEHTFFKTLLGRRKGYLEEKIARTWHWEMEWRKVLVALHPDAHNNMVVRRRFVNAFGWEVVDHMVENHFGAAAIQKELEFRKSTLGRETELFLDTGTHHQRTR